MKYVRRLWNDGPMWFVAAVVVYLAGLALFGHMQKIDVKVSNPFGSSSTSTSTTAPQAAPVDSGALQFQVDAFRVRTTDQGLMGNVTINVKNTGSTNATLRPGALSIQNANGKTVSAQDFGPAEQGVSPKAPRIVAVTFPLADAASPPYVISYDGRQIYKGVPGL